jgi:glycosyltransferase involved in cell wall biosynthesis
MRLPWNSSNHLPGDKHAASWRKRRSFLFVDPHLAVCAGGVTEKIGSAARLSHLQEQSVVIMSDTMGETRILREGSRTLILAGGQETVEAQDVLTNVTRAEGHRVRRVLFISYPFPPVGGAGVQRTTKFVKYLRYYGWQPSVLTVSNPSVPARDNSLIGDIPDQTIVCRAKTLEPGYRVKNMLSAGTGNTGAGTNFLRSVGKAIFRRVINLFLQPDAQVLWIPDAVRQGKRLLVQIQHHAIIATAPPFSSFLIGAALSRCSGLPLVLDYRDEWDLSSAYLENQRRGVFSRCIQRQMQKQVIRAAKALIATTRSSAKALEQLRDDVGSGARVTAIYNGFDPDDFPTPLPQSRQSSRYRLTYIGTLWNLTSIEPLIEAVCILARRSPTLVEKLELIIAGRRTAAQQTIVDRLKSLPCQLEEHPYVDHCKAMDLLRSADGLCVLLSNLPGAGRVVPAKIFEYMAAKRSVLAIAPQGELWDILDKYPLSHRYSPDNVEEIAQYLAKEIAGVDSRSAVSLSDWDSWEYSRRNQAAQLAEILQAIA